MRPWLLRARDLDVRGAVDRAAAELGVMAGADRVEGTLFGNGERTIGRDEALSLVPGKPGSLALFKGALARKPRRVKKTETAEKTVS